MPPVALRALIGGYGPAAGGRADGVRLVETDASGRLRLLGTVIGTESPSFVVRHPDLSVVYAADEAQGLVSAYAPTSRDPRSREPWRRLGHPVETGAAPCHLAVHPASGFLLASCYGDGDVHRITLGRDGSLGLGRTSLAPSPAIGAASKAHAALMLRDGRVMTTDLGLDLVRIWRAERTELVHDHDVAVASGPRHLVQHPDGRVLVVTEHSCEIAVLQPDNHARFVVTEVAPACTGPGLGVDFAAEICLAPDGRLAYVGIRGRDVIATVTTGTAELIRVIGEHPSGGVWPRHHALVGDRLLVANERSDEVTVLGTDARTGAIDRITGSLSLPSPTVICAL